MPPQITCAAALPGKTWKHENSIFHSNAVLVHQSLLDFFSLFDSRLIRCCITPYISYQSGVQFGAVGGHGSGEMKSRALQQLDCIARTMHQCAVFWVFFFASEALDRWGGKTNHCLISYFLSNTSVKHYRNRVVYVKIIASRRWDVFLRHSVVLNVVVTMNCHYGSVQWWQCGRASVVPGTTRWSLTTPRRASLGPCKSSRHYSPLIITDWQHRLARNGHAPAERKGRVFI